jgi:mRNA-degrading endonuclease YafQ of YafQ-DinJ toxin-antitoxin module
MRMIERSTAFKRDYKRIKANPRYRKDLDALVADVLKYLLLDKALPEKYLDHSLSGSW